MAITFPSLPTAEDINARLDELESRLPALPARIFKFQRSLAAANCERTSAAVSAVTESAKAFFETARTSGATVAGQARAAAGDVATSVRTVAGQARAQGRTVASAAESQATKLVDQAIDAVDDTPGSGTPYEEWTKAQLVDRAKELNIVGPTRMSKAELIAALRAA